MEILSRVHQKNLVSWARDRENILVLSADLTGSCEADLFRDTYPSRFISCGIAEQNMMSVAGGLAREGFIPLVHTFAVFIYRRAYDQIAMSVAYPNLPVKMFGFLPGVVTPGGATHQAIEDVSVMRALPNMTILETGDATDVESVLDVMRAVNGPVYIRMLRGEVPRLFDAAEPMKLDTPRILSKGTDVTIISSGICTEETLRAASAMKKKGVSVNHVHVSTLKPFNNKVYADIINTGKYGVITVENHTTTGGLGTIVAEKAVACGINKRMARLGLRDTFTHGASRAYLMKEHGFDAASIIHAVEKLSGNKLNISDDELSKVRIEAVHSEAKAEGL
ncbi:MAG: 1-deoxy-D-xylulose-5-phosphate synthase [Candidatus Aerophobetes bacterium ADurb.Bin490]|nr:MAG: 1-deoxy-D-xylulose-5-phosphate synthase [Candidatus Aerophobetes bacterium ADurb.Bin490]HPI04297.1 transketolase C-terminal domain-containing protein [Candidatus Goldiibacteriota bacterium]HRQ44184.1 transketolase C-terminal domain-containing protein [Candidatus Goldiibacteriota bacterium]